MSEPTPFVYKTFYDLSRIVLWADSTEGEENKRASFKLSFRDGNPRFAVNTGVPGRDGMINFPMDIPHFVGVLNLLKDVATGPRGRQVHVDSSGPVYVDNKPTQQLEVKAVLHFGKTNQGVVYVSVTADNRPKIIFPIQPSKWHEFRDTEKNKLDPETVSKSMTLGLADILLGCVAQLMVSYTNEEYTHGTRKPLAIGPLPNKPKPKTSADFSDLDEVSL